MRYYLKYKNAVNFVTIPLVLIGLSTVLPPTTQALTLTHPMFTVLLTNITLRSLI